MPRHVDVDERRRLVADAVWRIVLRDGLDQASVRRVAAEAGLSMGAISHWFDSQQAVQLYALQLVEERASARLAAPMQRLVGGRPATRASAEAVLWALLPVDVETREEAHVYYAFLDRARVSEPFRVIAARTNAAIFETSRLVVGTLADAGFTRTDLDREVAARELHALTEGLALQGATWPDTVTPAYIRAVVRKWLDGLAN